MTYARACGKTPDKWDDKTETFRTSIDKKAAALADKLRGKDPNIAPKVAVDRPTTKTETEETHTHLVLRLKSPEQSKPSAQSKPSVVYIDSQGGTGFNYHFIRDKHLFDSIDTSYKTVHVGGVIGESESKAPSMGLGTCTLNILTDTGPVAMQLTNCLYVPGMDSNVFNV